MTDYSFVLAQFDATQTSEKTWRYRCPVHKGGMERHPSASAWIGRDGRLMLGCWGCGAKAKELVKAVGLTMSDLFPDGDDKRDGKPVPAAKREAKRKIVATYPYRDEAGVLLYEVCRYEPKGFSQRRPCTFHALGKCSATPSPPDCRGTKDGWHWSLGNVRRVPYRLPDLLARPDWPVVVVEGEKDADRLTALGLLATCNSGGAGEWKAGHSQALRGRRVVVIPDNGNSAEWEHAFCVAGSLIWHGAAEVRITAMPDGHKDVSDYLDAGGSKADLLELIGAAPIWMPRRAA